MHRPLHDETGDILSGWFVRLALFLLVLGLIAYDGLSPLIFRVILDSPAREVAVAARDAYRSSGGDQEAALAAAETEAESYSADVVSMAVEGQDVVVVIGRDAPTLVIDRIEALRDYATPTARGRARLGP